MEIADIQTEEVDTVKQVDRRNGICCKQFVRSGPSRHYRKKGEDVRRAPRDIIERGAVGSLI